MVSDITIKYVICDYADSHKHKKWQPFAAIAAAAHAKEFLNVLNPAEVNALRLAESSST